MSIPAATAGAGTTVYVGGLPPATTSEALAAAFAPNAPVHAVVIRTFGFCTFSTVEAACSAVEQTNVEIDGRQVHAALSHARYRSCNDSAAAARQGKVNSRSTTSSLFIKIPPARRQQSASVVQKALAATCAEKTEARTRVHIPRKGGSNNHRGFAFVECGGAAEAASLLAALSQNGEWTAEMVRKKRGEGGGGKSRRRRGKRGGRHRGARSSGSEQHYEDDFESDDESDGEGGGAGALVAGLHRATLDADDDGDGDGDDDGDDDGGADGRVDGEDACIDAMASFISESREWALMVQGFLVEHCRSFDASEENRLEWYELHQQLVSMMESMLEAELSKLGVGVEEFVQRLQASRTRSCQAARELVDAVLAMDDFNEFKRMMLQLKADLDLANLPQDTLDRFASGGLAVTHTI